MSIRSFIRDRWPCRRPQYRHRRDVPASCAKCGAEPPPAPTDIEMRSFLKFHYSGWKIRRVWVFWPFYGWHAHCASCSMTDAIFGTSMIEKIWRAEKAGFTGGSVVVPFTNARGKVP